ncbi:uncharacterized protein LOC119287664 isoform X1 [Triticum dicoccoides]|uniref:uncharacterized protein LOC119287664 isoform X1 n=1 Tax=Triticum dicoccoides TaxID=85692 RepID=UPI00188ECD56|nr:uncharacterized protein LOC119287664 isoform X1 [Triticum dicoccoides]
MAAGRHGHAGAAAPGTRRQGSAVAGCSRRGGYGMASFRGPCSPRSGQDDGFHGRPPHMAGGLGRGCSGWRLRIRGGGGVPWMDGGGVTTSLEVVQRCPGDGGVGPWMVGGCWLVAERLRKVDPQCGSQGGGPGKPCDKVARWFEILVACGCCWLIYGSTTATCYFPLHGEIRALLRLRVTMTPVGAVSSLEALSWPCPSPDQAPRETPGSVRRARQRRHHGVVLSLETLRGCLECLSWRSTWCGLPCLPRPRGFVTCCHMLVVAVGMGIQGAMYSIFDAFFEMSSSS